MPSIDRPLADDTLRLGIEEELERLAGEEGVPRGSRKARTLIKDGPLRVTLVVLGPGAEIPAHHADGPITIQGMAGSVTVHAGQTAHELSTGDLLAVGAGIQHAVSSRKGGAFLLTLAIVDGS